MPAENQNTPTTATPSGVLSLCKIGSFSKADPTESHAFAFALGPVYKRTICEVVIDKVFVDGSTTSAFATLGQGTPGRVSVHMLDDPDDADTVGVFVLTAGSVSSVNGAHQPEAINGFSLDAEIGYYAWYVGGFLLPVHAFIPGLGFEAVGQNASATDCVIVHSLLSAGRYLGFAATVSETQRAAIISSAATVQGADSAGIASLLIDVSSTLPVAQRSSGPILGDSHTASPSHLSTMLGLRESLRADVELVDFASSLMRGTIIHSTLPRSVKAISNVTS